MFVFRITTRALAQLFCFLPPSKVFTLDEPDLIVMGQITSFSLVFYPLQPLAWDNACNRLAEFLAIFNVHQKTGCQTLKCVSRNNALPQQSFLFEFDGVNSHSRRTQGVLEATQNPGFVSLHASSSVLWYPVKSIFFGVVRWFVYFFRVKQQITRFCVL